MQEGSVLQAIQSAFRLGQYRFTAHGLREATADELAIEEIVDAIIREDAEIVEDYPQDARGPCCLILGWTTAQRPFHAVVSYPPDVAVITAYEPDPARWEEYRKRKTR